MKTHFRLLFLSLAIATTTQLNATIFKANDFVSLQTAVASVNAGAGGDTIQITGDILLTGSMATIKKDVTVTAETNPDGSPKYAIIGDNKNYYYFEIWISSGNKDFRNCTVENLIFKNSYDAGIYFYTAEPDVIFKVNNCIAMSNGSSGISISCNSAVTGVQAIITNCKASDNARTGIYAYGKKITIDHCTATNNGNDGYDGSAGIWASTTSEPATQVIISNSISSDNLYCQGFNIWAKETVLSNCIAENNKTYGFWIQYTNDAGHEGMLYMHDCTANGNGDGIVDNVKYSIINNCSAMNSYNFGTGISIYDESAGGAHIVSNTTVANNVADGFEVRSNCKLINCTAFQNKNALWRCCSDSFKVYNSILYGSKEYDIDINTVDTLYNTVIGNERKSFGSTQETPKWNCSVNDPKLLARTADGKFTESPDEIAYYALGEGSSALGLADKNLITKDMLTQLPDEAPSEVKDWFNSIITQEYVNTILKYDQIGSTRSFNGNKYDAGSISGIGGGAANSKIISYSPQKIANYGQGMIIFYGYDFDNNTKISLKMQGESDITPDTYTIAESGVSSGLLKYCAEFNFHNKKIGKWDISVAFADTTEIIKNGLEIEEYVEPTVELELIGSDNLRNGSLTHYIVKYQNKGNVDIYNVPVIIDIETDPDAVVDVKEDWQYIVPDGLDVSGLDRIDTLIDPYTGRLHTYVAPNVRYIGPYGTGYLSFGVKISIKKNDNDDVRISTAVFQPMFVVDPNAYAETKSSGMRAGGPCGIMSNNNFSPCVQSAVNIGVDVGLQIAQAMVPGLGCLTSAADTECNAMDNLNTMDGLHYAGNLAWDITKTAMDCVTDFIPVTKLGKAAWNVVKAMKTADDWINKANMGLDLYNNCGSGPGKNGKLLGSIDPNDKIGPVSNSGSKWFSDRKEFPYIIEFENLSTASAPAQEIWITDNLDLNVFDINTFEAGIIKIGSRLIDALSHIQNFTWSVDIPETGLVTNVDLKLDKTTGVATWHFKCIDPKTGELPSDPSVGFLPPNDDNGSGQGLVAYTIQLKDGLANNITVANKASIVFDNNEAIVTPTWENKKDVVPPTSSMISASNTGNGFAELKWQGTDNAGGSGVYSYDVYMKRNNDDYVMIFSGTTETSAQFAIDKGANYSFYTIATDNAGNREIKTAVPDVSLGIANVKADSHNSFKLYPNPADKECTLAFDMEKAGNIKITLSNILGANLMKIYDGYVESGTFKHTFDISSLPTGVYTVLIYAGNRITGEKLMIVK